MNKVDELAEAQAYRVEMRDGRIGSVAAVLPRAGASGLLLVHADPASCRIDSVLFDDVESVDSLNGRVVLKDRGLAGGTRGRTLART